MTIKEVVDARKKRFDDTNTWNLIKNADSIVTARGKKVSTWNPSADSREDILKHAMGPSGNLRAPTLRIGNRFIIGFNTGLYEEWMKTE